MKKILFILSLVFVITFNCNAQEIQETNYTSFTKNILKKDKGIIVVDFYATWCGPCKQMEPILNKVAKEFAGQISFYRVDVDKNQRWTTSLGISAIPTLIFYKKGKIKKVETGLLDYTQLKNLILEIENK